MSLDAWHDSESAPHPDTERLDWLDRNIGCEPRPSWNNILRRNVWVWMGNNFRSLREAIDAARKEAGEKE